MRQTEERADKRGLRGTHYGWVMVGNGAVVNAIGSVHAATFPIFFLPLQEEFKVGSAAMAFVLTMARVQGGIEGPLVGWFIDRTGPRLPAVLAALIGGVGFLILPVARNYWSFHGHLRLSHIVRLQHGLSPRYARRGQPMVCTLQDTRPQHILILAEVRQRPANPGGGHNCSHVWLALGRRFRRGQCAHASPAPDVPHPQVPRVYGTAARLATPWVGGRRRPEARRRPLRAENEPRLRMISIRARR